MTTNENVDATSDKSASGEAPANDGLFSPIIDQVLERHHRFVREETPRIRALLASCVDGCGESADAVGAVKRFFDGLADELETHMVKEEDRLFPTLRAVEAGEAREPLQDIIADLKAEHDHAGDALARTHVDLAEALLPEGARPEIEKLHERLRAFEEDLRAHVRAEDLLFARAEGFQRRVVGPNG